MSGVGDRRRAPRVSWRPVVPISAAAHHWAANKADWTLTAEQIQAETLLREQTERMVEILERCGIPVRAPDRAMSLVRPDGSGGFLVEDLDATRNVNLLPSIQKNNRRKNLKWLEAYLQQHPRAHYLRYYVVTSGERCRLDEVGARCSLLTQRMNRWRKKVLAPLGIEALAWSIEATIARDLTAHVHANVLLIPPKLSPAALQALYAGSSRVFKTHWRDAGRIKNLREFLKYAVKFSLSESKTNKETDESSFFEESDLFSLLDLPIAEIVDPETGEVTVDHPVAELHRQLFRRRLFHPLGNFKTFIRGNREEKLKPVKIRDAWCLAPVMPVTRGPTRNDSGVVHNIVCALAAPRPFEEGGPPLPSAIVRNFSAASESQAAADRLAQLVELFSYYGDATPARLAAWEVSFGEAPPLYSSQDHFNWSGRFAVQVDLAGSGVPPPEIPPLVRSASGGSD